MNKKVSKYLKEAKEKELIKRGLYDLKEEKDVELIGILDELTLIDFNEKYPDYEYKNEIYYKKVPYEVTDEEYEKILNVSYQDKIEYSPATISNALFVFGLILMGIGVLIGFAIFETSFGIPIIISSVFSGCILIALAKIVDLLNDIKYGIKK